MAGEVPTKLCTLPRFGFELQLDKFFNKLWAIVNSVTMQIHIKYVILISLGCLVNG